jgi:glutathione peroxidase
MKANILYIGFLIIALPFQSSIYNIQIESINGSTIGMNAFSNKKILITTISYDSVNIQQLLYLDSLQNTDTSLKVIAIPAKDFSDTGNDTTIAELVSSLDIDIVVTKSAYVRKSAGSNQQPLSKWLTSVTENMHFDADIESIGQFFIVSKTGVLYSVLNNDVPTDIFYQILNQNI